MSAASPARWFIRDGGEVTIGDLVALSITPDTVGVIEGVSPDTGLPRVRITEGPGVGGIVHPYPQQMLIRVHRR